MGMKLIDLLTSEERQQLRVRSDDASFRDYVNELLNKEVNTVEPCTCAKCGVKFASLHPAHYCPFCGACMD